MYNQEIKIVFKYCTDRTICLQVDDLRTGNRWGTEFPAALRYICMDTARPK